MFYFAPCIPDLGDSTVRHYVRKRTFSTMDRVLVHLSSDALQPAEQTQEGIAAATRSGRSTLTKWLIRLEGRKLVTRDRIRLPGHPLPKYAYRLTEAGWRASSALRARLETKLVTVRAAKLGSLSVRLTEVPTLNASRLDLTGTVATVRKGRLDFTKPPPQARRQEPAIWGSGLRRVDRFFGRNDDLRSLDRWWSSKSKALVVTGLPGIGKSALVASWVQRHPLDASVYGFEVRSSSTGAEFLSDFSAFLASLGKAALAVGLAQGVPLDPAFVARLLERDLAGMRVLVIIDNADQAPRDLAPLVQRVCFEETGSLPVRAIFISRRHPRWLARTEPRLAYESRRLRGLDHEAAIALLRSRGLGPETSFIETIVRKTRGHPLLLQLAASTGVGPGPMGQSYLQREVWDALPLKDRTVLEVASVLRKSVSEHALETVTGAGHSVLESLAERGMIERTIAGGFLMHDLVREFVASQLPETRRRRLHARAASFFLKAMDSRERWEGVFHLLAAGMVAEAASILDSEGAPLLDSVAAEDIASLVHGITLDETDAATYCVFAEILGDSLRIRGHVAPAIFQYGHAQRLAERAGQAQRIPRLLRKQAFLQRCRNRYAKALGYLVEARARLEQTRNPTETVEVLRELALSEQATGDLDQASRHLSEAIDMATDGSDKAALTRTLLALGTLETQRGRLGAGLELDLEALRIAERSGNVTEIAHAHIVTGTALITMGRPQESLQHLREAFEAARLLGNLRLMAYATTNQTSAFLHLARYQDAAAALREAKDSLGILEEQDTLGFLKTYEGEVEMGLGHWSRASAAWREGISELRTHGSPSELALVLWDVAGLFAAHGDEAESEAYLIEARGIAQQIGNFNLLSRIDSKLGASRAGTASSDRA